MNKELSLAKCSFIYFFCAFLFLLLKIFSSLGLLGFLGSNQRIIINVFLQVGVMFLIPLLLYMFMHKRNVKQAFCDFGFKKVDGKIIAASFAAGFFCFLCVVAVSSFMSGFWYLIGYRNPFSGGGASAAAGGIFLQLIIPIIAGAVLPGFCEEFINRGLLQHSLLKLSVRKAIFFSALLFALLHYNINQAVYAFLVGLMLGAITHFTKSIWPAVIIHFTNNFCAVFFDYASRNNLFGGQFNVLFESIFEGSAALVMIKFTLYAAFAFAGLLYFVLMLYKNSQKKEREVVFADVLVKVSPLERTFLYSAVFMTACLTFFTLVWGFL